jgi:arylsulfatase A-like enzyme
MDEREFQGRIGRYWWESEPWWPPQQRAPDGAPNVVMVVLDDVGFAQLGCFGSDIQTPVIDRLAREGLRYSNFHTTGLCSPTRACLLTGRNHHRVGMGRVIELATGYPGYDARLPRSTATLAEILAGRGWATWAVGKWHLTPEEECHGAATKQRWPLGRGFERFYGFFAGETHQYAPALVEDNHQIDPPRSIEDGYHLTEDLVDQAIRLLRDLRSVDVDKPFFLYFCPGACHSPHQVPRPWIDRYRGHFDSGWDAWRQATLDRQLSAGLLPPGTKLSPRPDWVPPWAALDDDEKRLYARYMEAFAGFLTHTDFHLGRLIDGLAATGDLDRTLLVVLSDNGASSEGGPSGSLNDLRTWNIAGTTKAEALARIEEIGGPYCHNNYPWGWTVAGNTPFRRWKREVHEGGVADPLVVRFPRSVADPGAVRRQYVHAIDIAPTALELAGVELPAVVSGVEQQPMDGASFASTLRDPSAPSARRRQYYEMFGCRALYNEGWKAVVYHQIQFNEPGLDRADWELYNVDEDPSECDDLAAKQPARLAEMVELWWVEAARNQVLPLDNRALSELVLERPTGLAPRRRYVYYPDTSPLPEAVAVNVRNRSHRITAHVEVGAEPPQGVLAAQGSALGGWSLYVKDQALVYLHSFVGLEVQRVEAQLRVGPGAHELAFSFERTGDHRGTGVLLVDGAEIGRGEIARFTPVRFSLTGAGLTCGRDPDLAVSPDYRAPFAFNGTIDHVVIEVDGDPYMDAAGEAEVAITTQ